MNRFNLCCFHGQLGPVSNGNLPAFDIIVRKAREIAGDDIATNGNEERFPWQHRNFKSKTLSPKLRHVRGSM